jgi:hypothetical protein
VFRTAFLSIVLTLAVGQDASLLCEVWCRDVAPAGCQHQGSTTSPGVSGDDSCVGGIVSGVAFVREDPRRAAQNALAVSRFQLAPSPLELRPGFESSHRRSLEERPLLIALRI